MTSPIGDWSITSPSFDDTRSTDEPPVFNTTTTTVNYAYFWFSSSALGVLVLLVILSALFGNSLVIVGVYRFRRLRTIANSFLVSLAVADFLVALLVMPFSAINLIGGRWPFGRLACDLFNANDVLFSTASLLHLCCVAVDRYVAVTDPFGYDRKMSSRRVGVMLAAVWTTSALVSHVPIHSGWYSDSAPPQPSAHLQQQEQQASTTAESPTATDGDDVGATTTMTTTNDEWSSSTAYADEAAIDVAGGECIFEVNKVYAFVSSGVSFWIPATVMLFAYVKIFREAQRQERRIRALRGTLPSSNSSVATAQQQQQQQQRAPPSAETTRRSTTFIISTSDVQTASGAKGASRSLHRQSEIVSGTPNSLSYARRLSRRLQTDNKAARTLGIIMGAFIVCWLPFFTWYVVSTLCKGSGGVDRYGLCAVADRKELVSTLFWVGYANSALNPFIYAAFNREFRKAFHSLLSSVMRFVCCSCHGLSRHPLSRGLAARSTINSDAGLTSMADNSQ